MIPGGQTPIATVIRLALIVIGESVRTNESVFRPIGTYAASDEVIRIRQLRSGRCVLDVMGIITYCG